MNEMTQMIKARDLLVSWVRKIELSSAIDFYDINKVAENLCANLLNEIYDYQLINLNTEQRNFPAVDLGCDVQKIAFQISSTKDINRKINDTLDKFVKNKLQNRFSCGVRFLFLSTDKAPKLTDANTKKYQGIYSSFDDKHLLTLQVLTLQDLIQKIQVLYSEDNARFCRILKILESGLSIEDINQYAIDHVAMAFNGYPKRFLVDAIANTHKASAKSLEALAPEFDIKTAYDGKQTTFSYIPKEEKESYPSTMDVDVKDSEALKKGYLNFLEHGEDLKIDSEVFEFEGLPLLDSNLTRCSGKFTLSSNKRKVTLKLFTKNLETNHIEQFDDVYGEMRFGTKSLTFEGVSCKEIFKIKLHQKINLENYSVTLIPDSSSVTLKVLFEKWNNLNINSLCYFNKLLSLFSNLVKGYELNISLEFEGNFIESFKVVFNQNDSIKKVYAYLKYTELCRIVSNYTKKPILFSHGINCTAEEYEHISEIVNIIQGNEIYKEEDICLKWIIPDNFKDEDFFIAIKNSDEMNIHHISSFGENIKLFNQEINLPPREFIASPVIPVIDVDISTLKVGDEIRIKLIPQKNFSLKINYKN